MGFFWLVAYWVLAGLAIVHAAIAVLQTWEHRRFARSRLRLLRNCRPTGRAMVYAPCKGVDVGLEENLRRLFRQDYDDYEITFIVQSNSDPACEPIRRLMAEHPEIPSHLVVAGRASESGQKVHNLRVATERIPAGIDFLVFVDSDAQPRTEWLRALIGRLGRYRRKTMGAATGYRWMIPAGASPANWLLYGINCNVAMLFGSRAVYPVWGGSWAVRREVFESVRLHEAWEGTLSDDLVAGPVLARHGRRVKFEPACMVASPLDTSLGEMFSFLRRQYLIGRFYTPRWWALGLLCATLPNLVRWTSLGAVAWGLATGAPNVWLPAVVFATLYGLNVMGGIFRQSLVQLYFPHLETKLRAARRFDIWAGPLVGLVNWLGMIASMVGRHITWRGITYRLHAGGRIEIVGRKDEPSEPEDEAKPPVAA